MSQVYTNMTINPLDKTSEDNLRNKVKLKTAYSCFLLCLFISFPLAVGAQVSYATQSIRSGDTIYKQQLSYKHPGRSGKGIVWDFSRLKQERPTYALAYGKDPAKQDLIVAAEHATSYVYRQTADSLLLIAMENGTTKMDFVRPKVQSLYTNRQTRQYCYQSAGVYCEQAWLQTIGVVSMHRDASGIIILPEGDTLRNVFRTICSDWGVQTVSPLGTNYIPTDSLPILSDSSILDSLSRKKEKSLTRTYRWYAPGYRYPVYECVEHFVYSDSSVPEVPTYATNFFYPPQEHHYLPSDDPNWSILHPIDDPDTSLPSVPGDGVDNDSSWLDEIYYNAFPNPVRTNMRVELKSYKSIPIVYTIVNNTGQVYLRSERELIEGFVSKDFDCSSLPDGDYVLILELGSEVKSIKFMKR